MRVLKKIICDPVRIPTNVRYVNRKKVRAATVKISKIVSLNSVVDGAFNIVAEMVGYKNQEITGNRQPHWQRRIFKKQKKWDK